LERPLAQIQKSWKRQRHELERQGSMIYPVFFHLSDWLAWMRSTKLAEEILRSLWMI
jgi:hypothetical protein